MHRSAITVRILRNKAGRISEVKREPIRKTLSQLRRRAAVPALLGVMLIVLSACGYHENTTNEPAPVKPAEPDGSAVMAHYFALDRGKDSVLRMRVKIKISGESTEPGTPSEVEVKLYSKQPAAGGRLMFIEFLSPAQERDRDTLITIGPDGEVEGLRYVQSNDSFLTTKGVTSEDALFGMTSQEIADGQPEKYDFKLLGVEIVNKWQAYKLEGNLKPGAESKFPRVVLFLAKDNYVPIAAEFYDNHYELVRRLSVEELAQTEGHWTRMRWTLENLSRGKRLEFQMLEARYNQDLSDSIFSRANLKKSARQ
jgi:hypothetical protein